MKEDTTLELRYDQHRLQVYSRKAKEACEETVLRTRLDWIGGGGCNDRERLREGMKEDTALGLRHDHTGCKYILEMQERHVEEKKAAPPAGK